MLAEAIREAKACNPQDMFAPAAILWTDKERQWEPALEVIRESVPELLILGDYDPENHAGPGIWLRCAMAGTLGAPILPKGEAPVIYLPGCGRWELRASEDCPGEMRLLAELRYRGAFFSMGRQSDWTVSGFLTSERFSPRLEIAGDEPTSRALLRSLDIILSMDLSELKGRRIDSSWINSLMFSDFDKAFLQWLGDPGKYRSRLDKAAWESFVGLCESGLGFNPETGGHLKAAELLATSGKAWDRLWERFREAPERHPGVARALSELPAPSGDLRSGWETPASTAFERWPSWNREQEDRLRSGLLEAGELGPACAREAISKLESGHRHRRGLVWAELGQSPLAVSLGHLAAAAEATIGSLDPGGIEFMEDRHEKSGWKIDAGVFMALAEAAKLVGARGPDDFEAVAKAARAFYLPWLETSAMRLQAVMRENAYPAGRPDVRAVPIYEEGDLVLFAGGLRFDLAKRLSESLAASGLEVAEEPLWAALPSVTGTGKPAASPVREAMFGDCAIPPSRLNCWPKIKTSAAKAGWAEDEAGGADERASEFSELAHSDALTDAGWKVLERFEAGSGNGKAWSELGDIRQLGRLPAPDIIERLDALPSEIELRVKELLKAGWRRVTIVTDHGWLLMPGGFPKEELKSGFVGTFDDRWAGLRKGDAREGNRHLWHWHPEHSLFFAEGVRCFYGGLEFACGGLSFQECLLLRLSVLNPPGRDPAAARITSLEWITSRSCEVVVSGSAEGLAVDLRMEIESPGSSVASSPKQLKASAAAMAGETVWKAIVKLIDDDMEGRRAYVVVLDEKGASKTFSPVILGRGVDA